MTRLKKSLISKKTIALLRLIPGYDPFRDAAGFYFDEAAANKAVQFIETCCTFTAGEKAGQPFILEPWQKSIVMNTFGWKRDKDHLRRYREVFIFVPRKNGKTELTAAIALCVMFVDNEKGAQIYSAAAEREQAALVFNAAKTMILQNTTFEKHAKVWRNAITRMKNDMPICSYKAISADANTKHGYNAHCILIDELHAHKNSELMDVLITSTGARQQPLTIIITTSDYEREGSPCNERHKYAGEVRDGYCKDFHFLPVIYEATLDDDWTSEAVWKQANPNYGISLKYEYLARECEKAKQSPSYENVFKRLHLNIRTENQERLFDMDAWDDCITAPPLEHYDGKMCWGGLDLGATSDLTALCLAFKRHDDDDTFDYYWWHWTPRHDIINRGRKHGIDYMALASEGELILTEGNETDYAVVRRDINELCDRFGIVELAVDRLFQGAQLSQQLMQDGVELVTFGQGYYSMAAPTLAFTKRVSAKRIGHIGSDIMRWQARNTQAEMDAAGNIKPSKSKSKNKIDGIVSAIMATALACKQDEEESIYNTRGVLVL
jgi:phage terminase large subunit-like protein